MIEIKDGHSNLSGTRAELLEETTLLFDALLDVAPEVLIVCLNSYETAILEAVKKSNPIILKMGETIVSKVREHIEDDEV